MFSRARKGKPRHMAGSKHKRRPPQPGWAAAVVDGAVDAELAEVPPVARVHRSRLAFAVSATLAALPILVLDNFPATADPAPAEEVQATAGAAAALRAPSTTSTTEQASSSTSSTEPPTTVAPPTTQAPTTSLAPEVTEAPEISRLAASAPAEPPTTVAPTTTTTAPPAPALAPPSEPASAGDPNDPATWDRLAQCESHGNWKLNSGNGYYGGLQFSLASWRDVGGTGYPHQHSKAEQVKRGKILQARYGWGQWPACADKLGYR